jgi:hypothetical protein
VPNALGAGLVPAGVAVFYPNKFVPYPAPKVWPNAGLLGDVPPKGAIYPG